MRFALDHGSGHVGLHRPFTMAPPREAPLFSWNDELVMTSDISSPTWATMPPPPAAPVLSVKQPMLMSGTVLVARTWSPSAKLSQLPVAYVAHLTSCGAAPGAHRGTSWA